MEAGWGTEAALPLVEDEAPPEAAGEGVQLSGDMAAEREADIGTSTTQKNSCLCSVFRNPDRFGSGRDGVNLEL